MKKLWQTLSYKYGEFNIRKLSLNVMLILGVLYTVLLLTSCEKELDGLEGTTKDPQHEALGLATEINNPEHSVQGQLFIPEPGLILPNEILGVYPYNMDANALGNSSYPANFSMTSACPLLLQALDTVTGDYRAIGLENVIKIGWVWNDGINRQVTSVQGIERTLYGGFKNQFFNVQPFGEFGWTLLSGAVFGCDSTAYDELHPYTIQNRKIEARVMLIDGSLYTGTGWGRVRREDAQCVIQDGVLFYSDSLNGTYDNLIENWLSN